MLPEQEKLKESIKVKARQLVWKDLELSNLMVDYALDKRVITRLSKELDMLKNDLEGSWEDPADAIESARQLQKERNMQKTTHKSRIKSELAYFSDHGSSKIMERTLSSQLLEESQ